MKSGGIRHILGGFASEHERIGADINTVDAGTCASHLDRAFAFTAAEIEGDCFRTIFFDPCRHAPAMFPSDCIKLLIGIGILEVLFRLDAFVPGALIVKIGLRLLPSF